MTGTAMGFSLAAVWIVLAVVGFYLWDHRYRWQKPRYQLTAWSDQRKTNRGGGWSLPEMLAEVDRPGGTTMMIPPKEIEELRRLHSLGRTGVTFKGIVINGRVLPDYPGTETQNG